MRGASARARCVVASVSLAVGLARSRTQPLGLGLAHLAQAAPVQAGLDVAPPVQLTVTADALPPRPHRLAAGGFADVDVFASPCPRWDRARWGTRAGREAVDQVAGLRLRQTARRFVWRPVSLDV